MSYDDYSRVKGHQYKDQVEQFHLYHHHQKKKFDDNHKKPDTDL